MGAVSNVMTFCGTPSSKVVGSATWVEIKVIVAATLTMRGYSHWDRY